LKSRMKFSLLISLSVHILLLGVFGYFSVKNKQNKAFITDIEIVEPLALRPPPELKEEKPKNIWEFMKMALPVLKKPEPQKDEKLLDITKKDIEKALEVEKKLVDKIDPLKKSEALKFKDLQKDKDLKLADIMKTMGKEKLKELVDQERRITDKEDPLTRKSDALKFEEVGLKRAENLKEFTDAKKKSDEQRLREITTADLLTDKKKPPENPAKSANLGINLTARGKVEGGIKEVIGTDEERKKVREIQALEAKLVDKVPVQQVSNGGGEKKPAIGYGGGGISLKPEELKRNDPKVSIAPARKFVGVSMQEKTANKASVELSGPLQGRVITLSPMPTYLEWMKEKGIAANVAVKIIVAPSGVVREDISVEQTSGYAELDKLVVTVLKTWQFEALPKSAPQQDQWGIITIRFKLK